MNVLFATGTYAGSGAAKPIAVGFRPKAVIVSDLAGGNGAGGVMVTGDATNYATVGMPVGGTPGTNPFTATGFDANQIPQVGGVGVQNVAAHTYVWVAIA